MATVPVTRTWVAGEVVTAAHFNTNIRDVFNFLLAPPIAELRQASAQSIPNNTHTAVTFDSEDVDSAGGHSLVTNTSRYTFQYPGWYELAGGHSFATDAVGARGSYWAKNGTAVNGSNTVLPTVSGLSWCGPARTKQVFGNVSDYAELFVYQGRGSALNTSVTAQEMPHASIRWVSN